jgi:hypothetical protein
MLGRQETEGVLGKSRKAGLTGFGVSSSAKEHEKCFSDGWPFRVFEVSVNSLLRERKQHRPTEVAAVKRD